MKRFKCRRCAEYFRLVDVIVDFDLKFICKTCKQHDQAIAKMVNK